MSRRLIDLDKYARHLADIQLSYDGDVYDGIELAFDALCKQPAIDAVELPCKIGDTVWIARRYKCHKRPRWGIVSEMFFTDNMELCIVVKGVARGKWGVDVFATYEEALAEIERRGE